jgi:cytochrome c553
MKLKQLLKLAMEEKEYSTKQIKEYLKKAEKFEEEIDFWKQLTEEDYKELTKLVAQETVKEINKLRTLSSN